MVHQCFAHHPWRNEQGKVFRNWRNLTAGDSGKIILHPPGDTFLLLREAAQPFPSTFFCLTPPEAFLRPDRRLYALSRAVAVKAGRNLAATAGLALNGASTAAC